MPKYHKKQFHTHHIGKNLKGLTISGVGKELGQWGSDTLLVACNFM